MKDVIFTTYSFGPLYVFQQARLRESILKIYPDANLRFWNDEDGASMPQPGRPPSAKTFHESMYGFKVHCIRNCLNEGFKQVIFLDAAIILEGKIEGILEHAREMGVLAAIDPSSLANYTSDKCLEYIHKSRAEIESLTLVGGSVYIFDFTNPVALQVFEYWEKMEADGIFGSEEEAVELGSHRKDETCLSLALNKFGCFPQPAETLGYHNLGQGSRGAGRFFFYKLHHKGIGEIHGHLLDQTIIPLHGNVLDLGCRDFVFADFFRSQEYNVFAVDIGKFEGDYERIAITDSTGKCFVQDERDPDATHITNEETGDQIDMMTIDDYSKKVGVDHWDLIKMDIEGSEFGILFHAKHPIASQITVEFHAHCGQKKEELDILLDMLSEFYYIHNRVWEEKHSAGFNYWSVLLIAKGTLLV